MPVVAKRDYIVNYYEVDENKLATPSAIVNYLQDIAVLHSAQLGLSIDRYNELNKTFILQKWDITFHNYPKLHDCIHVETCPIGFKSFYAFRTFHVYDEKGTLLVEAKSTWFLIDIKKRRPLRIPADFFEIFHVGMEQLEEDFNDWTLIKEIETGNSLSFRVRHSDMDTNGHVNNVRYIEWALEAVPTKIFQKRLKRLRVAYEKEILYGQTVESTYVVREDDSETSVCVVDHILKNAEGKRLTMLETTWE